MLPQNMDTGYRHLSTGGLVVFKTQHLYQGHGNILRVLREIYLCKLRPGLHHGA